MKRQSNSLTPKRKGMAQEKIPNEKPKRTRKPKAGSDALPVEQITELMLVHNKNDPKFGVQAVSEIDKDGKAKTVPADEKNENSFLKFDKNSSILENFIKNFWSQLKEPTHFRLLRMTYHDYKVNKQAIRDLSEGKQTDAVKEFLKRYEIRPRENKKEQSVNQKEKTAMADKETQPQEPLQQSEVQQAAQQQQQPQAQQAAQESQGPRYRYNPCLLFVKIFKYLCQHFKTAHTIEFSSVENRKRTYYLCDITAMIIVKLVHHGFRGIIAVDDSGYLVAVNVLYCVLV